MKKIDRSDVKNIYEYEKAREAIRARIIDLKRTRRVQVGPHLSFLFENRKTVLFQIQEMCRTERIVDDARVQEEIDAYNDLIPEPGELSATLFIEIEDSARIQELLDRFMGIDAGDRVWIQVGKEYAIPGRFEAGRSDEERGKLSAVHFVKFAFTSEQAAAFRDAEVFLVVDHPGEQARVRLSDEAKASLMEDLLA
ncbi:MAG: DUF3501 family protein [Candidatus Rokubacteria bacterium]|nr:DUF3501 family protein [Candidatus Rokubacteria bacterium]